MSTEPQQHPRRLPEDALLDVERQRGDRRDGRLERRRRNRHAVLDAYVDLTTEGIKDPTMEQLAEVAGVSHRSVFRYFDDRSALLAAVAEHLLERMEAHLTLEPADDADLGTRINRFVDAQVAAYGEFGPAAAQIFARCDDLVPDTCDALRARLREDLRRHFVHELAIPLPDPSVRRLDLAVTLFHFEAIHLLARSVEGSHERLADLLRMHLTMVLTCN